MCGAGVSICALNVVSGIPFSELSDEARTAWMRLYARVLGGVGEGGGEPREESRLPCLLTSRSCVGGGEESKDLLSTSRCFSGCGCGHVGSSVAGSLAGAGGACCSCGFCVWSVRGFRPGGACLQWDACSGSGLCDRRNADVDFRVQHACGLCSQSGVPASSDSGEADGRGAASGGNDLSTFEPGCHVPVCGPGVVGSDAGVDEFRCEGRNVVPGVLETKTDRNRRWRRERKEKKEKRKSMSYDWRVRSVAEQEAIDSLAKLRTLENNKRIQAIEGGDSADTAKASLKKKWEAENLLAAEQANRKLMAIKVASVEDEGRKYTTALRASIERNMVSIEQTHAKLSATGNVPGVFQGYAETEASGDVSGENVSGVKSGTISPNSSISEAEVRAMQKQILDMELTLTRYRQVTGISPAALDKSDKRVWTDTSENHAILEELYPMGYGVDTFGFPEGKFRPT